MLKSQRETMIDNPDILRRWKKYSQELFEVIVRTPTEINNFYDKQQSPKPQTPTTKSKCPLNGLRMENFQFTSN